jgi:hypothetical protein
MQERLKKKQLGPTRLAETYVETHHQNEAENGSPRSLSSVSAAKCQRGLH